MIIPAILTDNARIAQERVNLAKQMGDWLHLDILDNTLYKFNSLSMSELESLDYGDLSIEAHCMTTSPEALAESALRIERIIIHYELPHWLHHYDELVRRGIDTWVAVEPDTNLDKLELPQDLLGITLMGVVPGQSGQPMDPALYQRIDEIKSRYPDIAIGIDGGVREDTIRQLIAHGADNIVMGSALFSSPSPLDSYSKYLALTEPLNSATIKSESRIENQESGAI